MCTTYTQTTVCSTCTQTTMCSTYTQTTVCSTYTQTTMCSTYLQTTVCSTYSQTTVCSTYTQTSVVQLTHKFLGTGGSSYRRTTVFNIHTDWDRRCRDRMIVGFTYVISAYHDWCYEFESRSRRGIQHYVIKFVSDLRQVGGFLRVLQFPQPI